MADFKQEDPSRYYEMEKKIGKGASGIIYKANKIQENVLKKEKYAVKIAKLYINNSLDQFMIEVGLMKMCENANIVKCYETFVFIK